MMLQDKLNQMQLQFELKLPPATKAVMHLATDDLMRSGIMDRVLKVGDRAPEFILNDQIGNGVNFRDLIDKGPLVISFYRGSW
jgi:hypothetical protein